MLAGAPWALRKCGGGGDGVAGVVDVDDPVVVAVDAVPAGVLGGGVDRGAAPGVPGQAADAELHRPGRPGRVLAGMHPGGVRAALAGFDLADAGQHGPGDAVPGSGFLVVGEVGGGDGGCRGAGGRLGLAGAAAWPSIPAPAPRNAAASSTSAAAMAAVTWTLPESGRGRAIGVSCGVPSAAGSTSQTAWPPPAWTTVTARSSATSLRPAGLVMTWRTWTVMITEPGVRSRIWSPVTVPAAARWPWSRWARMPGVQVAWARTG